MNIALRKTWTMPKAASLALFFLLGILCLLPAKLSAQSSNRWLFIFNTSAEMRDRAKGLQDVTQDLLTTGMHGNMRPGDTIGIWTYDNELRASEAPLMTWSPDVSDSIAQHTLYFLSRHRYAKTAAFGDVLTNMQRVIKISDTITVILISDGSDAVTGTPFDARISAYYKTNFNQQRKEHLPIVTVFRGERGRITTNTLGLTRWVDIPQVPPPPPAPKVVAQAPPEAPPKPFVPSLVMIGRKTRSVTNTANLPDITQEPDTPPADIPVAATPPPQPTPAPAAVAAAETPKPAPAPAPVATVEPAPSPAPEVHSVPAVVAEAPKSVEPAPAAPAPNGDSPTLVLARESTNAAAAPADSSPAQPVVEAATNAPTTSLFSARNIAIVSVAFSVLMCVLLIIVARGARSATRASLITRSLEREQK